MTKRDDKIKALAAQLEAKDVAASKQRYLDKALRMLTKEEADKAARLVAARDPTDLQATINALPSGSKWSAARADYWVNKHLDLRGKSQLDLNFGGAVVTIKNREGAAACLFDDAPTVRLFNVKFTPDWVESEPEPADEGEAGEPEDEPEE